ncbi:MAG: hypothetical protein RLZZ361_1405, partial [Cyanobacteriota bacterium]
FYIYAYDPKQSVITEEDKDSLKKKLDQQGITVLEINLYDLVVKTLKDNGDWDWYIEKEPSMTKQELREELQGILDVEKVLTPEIAKIIKSKDHDLVFLTGIGEVFPYIRSHSILNNLQVVAKHKPTVIFFPGEYQHSLDKGATLKLFSRLEDDKYYRAFNIDEYEV